MTIIDPTPDTIRAIAEVLGFAKILDDRVAKADDGRVRAWAQQAQRANLTRDDLVDAVQAFYDADPAARDRPIGIADLVHHAKICRRTRIEKEDHAASEARRATHDQKAADETRAVLSGFVGGKVKHKTDRLIKAENGLQCAVDKASAIEAIKEFFAAKAEAKRSPIATGGAR